MTEGEIQTVRQFFEFVIGMCLLALAILIIVRFFEAVAYLKRIAQATETLAGRDAGQGQKPIQVEKVKTSSG